MLFTVPAVAAAVAGAIPDRPFIVQGERRHTYRETVDRSNRLATYLHSREVESAIASHPAVRDVVVAGRPSERWGQEVVAIVALADGADDGVDAAELIRHAETSIARYKLPKAVVFRPAIERSPAGKADYRWAREQAVSETS